MARVDLNKDTSDDFVARLKAIASSEQRHWGRMTPEALMRHLTYMLQLSLGEVRAEKVFLPVPSVVLWYLCFEWFTTWPKGKLKAPPSFLPDGNENLEEARARCLAAMDRFTEALESNPESTAFTPLLGHIPLTKWARVHGVHMDHHLRQFGV